MLGRSVEAASGCQNWRTVAYMAKPVPKPTKLIKYVTQLVDTNVVRSRREIAKACGMSDGALSNALTDPTRRLSIAQCLRLALRVKADPATVLRMAGREDDADLIWMLWPATAGGPLTQAEWELVTQWRNMDQKARHHIGAFMGMVTTVDSENAATAGRDGNASGAPWRPKRKARKTS
jgi:hypothetical protein